MLVAMTRAEMLRLANEAHAHWSSKYGDTVPYVAADANPHDGQATDLSLWNADRSAPPLIDDPLNHYLTGLLAQVDGEG